MTLSPASAGSGSTLAVVLLDRANPSLVRIANHEGWRHELIHNFMYLVHSRNPGLAWHLFRFRFRRHAHHSRWFHRRHRLSWLGCWSQSEQQRPGLRGSRLLLRGRHRQRHRRIVHVRLRISFEVWFGTYRYPAFNVADSAIFIGAALILFDILFAAIPKQPISNPRTPLVEEKLCVPIESLS